MMENVKNFKLVSSYLDKLSDETQYDSILYLKSEDGQDWYECQKNFADDTVKIMYDSDNIIRSVVDIPVPQRGNTYAVSMFFPLNMSVAEVAVSDYPAGCCIDGTWKFDGEKIYQDQDVVDANTLRSNTNQRNSLLCQATTAIVAIQCSAAVGNSRDSDSDNLLALQQYVDQLRDVVLSDPVWPTAPVLSD